MTSWGFSTPYAVITPDGETVVFNRCVPRASDGGCTLTVFRWTAAGGAAAIVTDGWVEAVSDDGHTALVIKNPGTNMDTIALWHDGAMIDVPLTRSARQLLTFDGTTVVGTKATGPDSNEVARWTAAGGTVTLGDLPGGPTASWPNAINGDASVIVGYGNTADGQEPFLWTAQQGAMVDLGSFPSSTVQAVALAATPDGSVVVGSSISGDSGKQYFRWTAASGLTAIAPVFEGTPGGGPGYTFMWPPQIAISDDGAVITGTAGMQTNPPSPGAFRWTTDAGWTLLTPGRSSIVRGVSRAGTVVLGSKVEPIFTQGAPAPSGFAHTPFYFFPGGGVRDLAGWLRTAGPDLPNLRLGEPIALSADGSMMVGHATCSGTPVIYRALLPGTRPGP
jgi:uncharacterized membrane protein